MPEVYVFGDEAGTLNFSPKDRSRYFIVTTVTVPDCSIGHELLQLRRQLAWEGVQMHPEFRASEEKQEVRDRVYAVLQAHSSSLRVDATIFEKRKVRPDLRRTEAGFYQFAWFYHFKYLAYAVNSPNTRLLIAPATLGGRKRKQEAFAAGVRSVVAQLANVREARCAFWMARTDPCLWAADYCSWAIQRKWEHLWQGQPDDRSHVLIRDKIRSEFDIFASGTATYY